MSELKPGPDLGPIISTIQINVHMVNKNKDLAIVVLDPANLGPVTVIQLLKESIKSLEIMQQDNQKLVS